jgi:hypothetical protein
LEFADIFRDAGGNGRVDPELLVAHEGFAGKFEENAFVNGAGGRGLCVRRHRKPIIMAS